MEYNKPRIKLQKALFYFFVYLSFILSADFVSYNQSETSEVY
jgi:hypothetical protein